MSGFFPMKMLFGGAREPWGAALGASLGGLGASFVLSVVGLAAGVSVIGVAAGVSVLAASFVLSVVGLAAGVSVFSDVIYCIPQ